MRIGLHSPDKTDFPNLALMKLSAWHKAKGHKVSLYGFGGYDLVYSSKVFTWSKNICLPEGTIKGGMGYGLNGWLDEEIEHTMPDYSLYGLNYSVGFLTRGCPRKCDFCFVPEKEGDIRPHADIEEFLAHDTVMLLDNNILAHQHGIEQLEKIAKLGVKIDINQGVDARLIDDGIAKLFSKIKWVSPVRLACDHKSQMKHVHKAVELMRWRNVKPMAYSCYTLVKDDIQDAIDRIKFLKGIYVDPYAMSYIGPNGEKPSQESLDLERYVNHKATFKSTWWENYKK